MENKKALIILAEGFEEVEAVTAIDLLRRSGVEVTVAGLDAENVKGSHGIIIKADTALKKYKAVPNALILPGGSRGAERLANSREVKELILKMDSEGRLIAAICAAPAIVLAPAGVLSGKEATCFPGMEENFSPDIKFKKEKVVQDGNVITSRGPATSFDFSVLIAENLVGRETADQAARNMLFEI
ncbi:MAG: DJ-1 family glyoxalase III [Candidatus Omnitrophota bacterium]